MRRLISLSELVQPEVSKKFLAHTVRSISHAYLEARVYTLSLDIARIVPLSRFAVSDRLSRAETLILEALRCRLKLFETMVMAEQDVIRIIVPPIVEVWPSGFYLLDGVHRLLATIRMRREASIEVLGVEHTDFPKLPCEPWRWDRIKISKKQKRLDEILVPLDISLFRPVSEHFNSDHFLFRSFSEVVAVVSGSG